jgi:hypothetical protein
LSQEPLKPATLFARQNYGSSVGPIETEERHSRCVEQRRAQIELVVTALRANDWLAVHLVRIGEMLDLCGIEDLFFPTEDSHENSFRSLSLELDMVNVGQDPLNQSVWLHVMSGFSALWTFLAI